MSKADPSEQAQWERALHYYRKRGAVLFLSYCRFWERHGFVQQSLAHRLSEEGIEVVWLDGAGWRPYGPVVVSRSPRLEVCQLPALPLRRLSWVEKWDKVYKGGYVRRVIKRLGGNPLVWVQAGLEEGVAQELPYVDVYSVFDDPYRHGPNSPLARKARVLVCQNEAARETLGPLRSKAHVLLPPMDMADSSLQGSAEIFLPAGFPEKVMGYVGSFFSDGFDLELFEKFIQAFPSWGFVMMGRTDSVGAETVRRWKTQYTNFHYFPWVPRNQVAAVWKTIALSLLFYKPNPTQDGAFPVKILEGLRFGVPSIATLVPKTAGLAGVFPRSNDLGVLVASVDRALAMPKEDLEGLYQFFKREMDPKHHLTQVAGWLGAESR